MHGGYYVTTPRGIDWREEEDKLQKEMGVLPVWSQRICDKIAANPPTPEEWQWILDNKLLIFKAIMGMGRTPSMTLAEDAMDMLVFLAPRIVYAMRKWEPSRGSSLSSFVYNTVQQGMSWRSINANKKLVPKSAGSTAKKSMLLLGDYGIERKLPTEHDPDPELLSRVQSSFSRLHFRYQAILKEYLGLGCKRVNGEELAKRLGITRERVYQIVQIGLQKVATKSGLQIKVRRAGYRSGQQKHRLTEPG